MADYPACAGVDRVGGLVDRTGRQSSGKIVEISTDIRQIGRWPSPRIVLPQFRLDFDVTLVGVTSGRFRRVASAEQTSTHEITPIPQVTWFFAARTAGSRNDSRQ